MPARRLFIHILSISGSHIALVTMIMIWLGGRLRLRIRSKVHAAAAAIWFTTDEKKLVSIPYAALPIGFSMMFFITVEQLLDCLFPGNAGTGKEE